MAKETRVLGGYSLALEQNEWAKKVLRSSDLYRDARRVLEGWYHAKLSVRKMEDGQPEQVCLTMQVAPLGKRRDYLTELAQRLSDVIRTLDKEITFGVSVSPGDEVSLFSLYFPEAKDAVKMQQLIKERHPELLVELQETLHVPDEQASGRTH